jgi:hypothetical protein
MESPVFAYSDRLPAAKPDRTATSICSLRPDLSAPFFPGGLIADLEAELGRRIDVTTRSALHPRLREEVLREAVPL